MREALIEILMRVRAGWRYRWYAMFLACVVSIIGWSIVFLIPDKYTSTAKVYVDTDSILRPLLRGLAVQTNVSSRLRLMTKTLLSRPNLEKIARETDLDITAKTVGDHENLINGLKKSLTLKGTARQNLYTISFEHHNPKIARDVVQALMTIFVESTLGGTRLDSSKAQKFLGKQIQEYESRLVEAENKLTEFKRKHLGTLPGQDGGVFQRLRGTKSQYEQAKLKLKEARFKRNELKRQYEEGKVSIASGATTPVTAVDSRILALQQRLDQLLLRFTEEHPDVKEIRQTIVALEAKKIPKKKGNKDSIIAKSTLLEQLKLSLGKAESNLAALRVRVAEYKRRLDKLRKLVDTLPQVETELKRLTRDYGINKKNYDALVSRRESAKMAERADAAGDSVSFKIIEPPRLPAFPASPKRKLLSVGVLLLALGAGGVLAFLLSELHPVVFDTRSLRKVSGYPVFGSVSRVWTPALLFKRKLEVGAFFSVVAGLVIVFFVVLFLQGYSGDIQWIIKLRGSGL